ncbi:hypothetical protein [Neptuniibacter sp. QD37_11]|uniref:hypothetical protein n=1 Tax=Neptuniibacter sp. QD37_11 TaxID=3398209 RepID=UPI0039F58839
MSNERKFMNGFTRTVLILLVAVAYPFVWGQIVAEVTLWIINNNYNNAIYELLRGSINFLCTLFVASLLLVPLFTINKRYIYISALCCSSLIFFKFYIFDAAIRSEGGIQANFLSVFGNAQNVITMVSMIVAPFLVAIIWNKTFNKQRHPTHSARQL